MDEKLKNSLGKIKELVEKGEKDEALKIVNDMLNSPEYKPYESALKKIKVDIIYALNLERIDPELGKKAYSKVSTEIDSALQGKKTESAQSYAQKDNPPVTPQSNIGGLMSLPSPIPMMPLPILKIDVPEELLSEDPYDIDNIDIEKEIGPLGFINDVRRTVISLFDPMLPMKLLSKSKKK